MRVDLEKFKGIFMAMYSAYDDNGNVDKERVKKLARYYADKKVKGLYVGGSSGEGVLQSEEERKQVVEAVMEEVGKELTIIVHSMRQKWEQMQYHQYLQYIIDYHLHQ